MPIKTKPAPSAEAEELRKITDHGARLISPEGIQWEVRRIFKSTAQLRGCGKNRGREETLAISEILTYRRSQAPTKYQVFMGLYMEDHKCRMVGILHGQFLLIEGYFGNDFLQEQMIPFNVESLASYGLRLPFEEEIAEDPEFFGSRDFPAIKRFNETKLDRANAKKFWEWAVANKKVRSKDADKDITQALDEYFQIDHEQIKVETAQIEELKLRKPFKP